MIAIVNYGVGNLTSVLNMFRRIGADAVITDKAEEIKRADRILLPGVGNFDTCMQRFNASGLRSEVEKKAHEEKRPLLGICVGAQMITRGSEEGKEKGLGWVNAETIRFQLNDQPQLKIPNMGWNELIVSKESPLWNNLPPEPRFYFAHSYHFKFDDETMVTGKAYYGYEYPVAFRNGNIFGTQFHPEKSLKYGMKILENFSKMEL
ncbi:MAG TPA: imidazole glycerol phosphate synthase subunit HisH [Flavipsychrobacter sp.]|nr:imidazole glycerol phosphate synthase subunit HisH [Flavipsychrobacter sp.]